MVARVERVLNRAAEHAPPFWVDVPAFTAFAEEVQDAMILGELSLIARQRLLRRANHHGIRRFDANLIIAMVQNRAGEKRLVEAPSPERRWIFPLTIALTLQAIIVLAAIVLIYS